MNKATINVQQGSGHTIWSHHIEEPKQCIAVEFNSIGYVLHFADTHRRVTVLAETPEGALAVARYHYGLRGSNFTLVDSALPKPRQSYER